MTGNAALRGARALESADGLDPTVDAVQGFVRRLLDDRPELAAMLHGTQVGHALHPLLTDLPLGLWTGTGVLDLVGGERSHPAADRMLGLGVLLFFPTAFAGWADWSASDRAVRRVGLVHALLNGTAAALYGASWVLRKADHRAAGVVVSMSANVIVTVGGYLGGHMVYKLGAPTGGPEALERGRSDEEKAAAGPTSPTGQEAHPIQL